MSKPVYNAENGQYVLQIRNVEGGWNDYFVIKCQSDLDAAIRRAKGCKGAGIRAGALRVVHQYMGSNVIADYTHDWS